MSTKCWPWLLLLVMGCSTHTDTDFRMDPAEEYVRRCGYAFSCSIDADRLVVQTFTPASWGERFYYDQVHGLRCDTTFTITGVEVSFLDEGLPLDSPEVRESHTWLFKSPELVDRLDNLDSVVVVINGIDGLLRTFTTTYRLGKHEDTYHTGTAPHA